MKSVGAMQTKPALPDTVALRPAASESASHVSEVSWLTGTTGTGQRSSAVLRSGGRVMTYVALGFVLIMIGFYLRTQGGLHPATPAALPANSSSGITSTAEPKAAGDGGAPSEPARENRAGATSSKAEQPEPAKTSAAPTAASRNSGTSPGRGKASRPPSLAKTAERKNDDKPRRISKPTPTPIID
jgi:hypothetical protein